MTALQTIGSAVGCMVLVVVATVGFEALPDDAKESLLRWRGVLGAGLFTLFATFAIGFGVAMFGTDDHLGAATPSDAYVMGSVLIALGLATLGFAVATYRNAPLR